MRFASFLKSARPVTVYLVKGKCRESTKRLIEHGWDSYPGMDRCHGRGAGRFCLRANSPLCSINARPQNDARE
jgi:hypothetical protein